MPFELLSNEEAGFFVGRLIFAGRCGIVIMGGVGLFGIEER